LAGVLSGELPPNIDIATASDEIYGAIYYRLLIGIGALDISYMDTLFTTAMAGLSVQTPRFREKA